MPRGFLATSGDAVPLLSADRMHTLGADGEPMDEAVAALAADPDALQRLLRRVLDAKGGVPVRNRWYYFTKHKQCFVGFVMVEWLMHHGYAETREQGLLIGRYLLKRGYVSHVTNERDFQDDYYFYRWNLDREHLFSGVDVEEVAHAIEADGDRGRFKERSFLASVPISIYTSPMGTAGIALLWRAVSKQWPEYEALEWVYGMFLALAMFTFCTNTILYAIKLCAHPREVLREWINPATCNLFSTVSITLLNISVGLMDVHMTAAGIVWVTGTVLQSVLAVESVASWINRGRAVEQFNPTYFLPVVGLVLVPMVGLDMDAEHIVWCYWGVGLFYWIALFPIFFMRVVFVGMLPPKIVPSLFIAMAPPALIANSYMAITGTRDNVTVILNGINLFLFVLVVRIRLAQKSVPFSLAWWAYVFPLAATANASLAFAADVDGWVLYSVFGVLFFLANTMWVAVFCMTGLYLANFRLFLA